MSDSVNDYHISYHVSTSQVASDVTSLQRRDRSKVQRFVHFVHEVNEHACSFLACSPSERSASIRFIDLTAASVVARLLFRFGNGAAASCSRQIISRWNATTFSILRVTPPRDTIKLHDVTERARDRFSAISRKEIICQRTTRCLSLKGRGSTLSTIASCEIFLHNLRCLQNYVYRLYRMHVTISYQRPTWTHVLELLWAAAIKKVLLISATLNADACDCRSAMLLKLLLNSDVNKEIGLYE